MGMIEDLGGYVAASTGTGTLGTDLFLNFMPESTAVTATLVETAGVAPEFTLGGNGATLRRPSIDLLVRSTAGPAGVANPTAARARIERIWTVLAGVANQVINGTTYLRVEPDNDPYLVDRDEKGRVVFGASFSITRRA